MKDSQPKTIQDGIAIKYIKANNERFSTNDKLLVILL